MVIDISKDAEELGFKASQFAAVEHNASFRKYLYDRFISHVSIKKFHSVDVEGNIDHVRLLSPACLIKLRQYASGTRLLIN